MEEQKRDDFSQHKGLIALHQKKSGRLVGKMVQTMAELVGEQGTHNPNPFPPVASTYLLTVHFTQHPPRDFGPRPERELRMLMLVIDLILKSENAKALDVLAQRVKALERSAQDKGWDTAKWLEFLPTGESLLVTCREARAALEEDKAETQKGLSPGFRATRLSRRKKRGPLWGFSVYFPVFKAKKGPQKICAKPWLPVIRA